MTRSTSRGKSVSSRKARRTTATSATVYAPGPKPLGSACAYGQRLAALNDQMRQAPEAHGEILFDATLAARPAVFKRRLLAELARFDTWYPGSDPRGHHDFGLIMLDREKILFQFQYRSKADRRLEADDPTDVATTHRVIRLELFQ